jgi:BirA family transcriptional regulator, biotin operon repressor / biotin---[acetyl-CoA-carboxylase] ligase
MAVSFPGGVDLRSVLELLADGGVHSGVRLARELKVGHAAIGKAIGRLRALGIEVKAVARSGYCLTKPLELLDGARIRAAIRETHEVKLRHLEVLFEVDSTNTRLLGRPPPPEGLADVCISELQHSGRGRRGRVWIAPFGDSIALSLAWALSDATQVNSTLSLAVGVAIARALAREGARGISLKWPNDVWFDDRKIGGVLLELKTEVRGQAHVVIGVGLNVSLSPEARRAIEETGVRAAAVADACSEAASRNRLAGALLDELLSMLGQFEREGFAPFRDAWTSLDALRDRPARVLAGDGTISGIARGVDAHGALLLESGGQMHRFVSGEVSLRTIEGDA